MIVKVRVFQRTERITGPEQMGTMIESVRSESETFLATLALNNVCDSRDHLAVAGKDTTFTTFLITIYYLE